MALKQSSTDSAVSPICSDDATNISFPQLNSTSHSVEDAMKRYGYTPLRSLGQTLQGSVWKVKNKLNKNFIIKITNKLLHKQSITNYKGKQYYIQEDIIKEARILKYLTTINASNGIIKYIDIFQDQYNYYLVMEHGGTDFFVFVEKAHKFIVKGLLTIQEWQRFCKVAFKQMVNTLYLLHNKTNTCHLDISLENFVISDVSVKVDQHKRMQFVHNFQIKLIDFGLAEVFTNKNPSGQIDFTCSKYVGKTVYKSPEITRKSGEFDARSNDCWGLGVALFMMITGGSPWLKPTNNDTEFKYIMNGKLMKLLTKYRKLPYVTSNGFDLLYRIFKYEHNRIDINQIIKHPYLL